jgi:hypothetical protein
MAQAILTLREQLKARPTDWALRLSLADALAAGGLAQQAAIVVSSAPGEPQTADDLARAADHVRVLDAALAIRYTNAALALDDGHARAALVRAEVHRQLGEAAEARRFFVVAAALDPGVHQRAEELKAWLAEHHQEVADPASGKGTRATASVEEEVKPTRLIAGGAAPQKPVEARPAPVVAIADLKPPVEVAVQEDEVLKVDAGERADEDVRVPLAVVGEDHETPVLMVARDDEEPVAALASSAEDEDVRAPAAITPAVNRMLVRKLSAASVAILVHVVLFLLLGVLVIIVPQPKVAELVGIVAPEAVQELPQTKQIIPSAMPSPSVASAATSRAITATGVSSIALPEFDSKGALDAVPEIAMTDLGASFATPFAPKGTSPVNFFGIKSKGRRVAFLIDAERYMLTDPRGGYPAYQIVKEEIARMIGKLGLETFFNVILYEGGYVSAFSEKLLPATQANKDKVGDWLYPVNKSFEALGLRAINYPNHPVTSELEPVQNRHLSGYLRAIQFALESDVDAVFCIASGYRSMTFPRPKEELEKLLKEMKWSEKDDIALREAYKAGNAWLAKENAARKAKGVPERVIVSMGEVWRDMGMRPIPRQKPDSLPITAEMREEQVKNAIRVHYTAQAKTKPQINFVIFIGKDQDPDTVPQLDHFENIAQRSKGGKVRVLQGLAALKNVTGR